MVGKVRLPVDLSTRFLAGLRCFGGRSFRARGLAGQFEAQGEAFDCPSGGLQVRFTFRQGSFELCAGMFRLFGVAPFELPYELAPGAFCGAQVLLEATNLSAALGQLAFELG